MDDPILRTMASELHRALIAQELDPKDPPTGSRPPTERAFEAYQKRGGTVYSNPDLFMQALITEVGQIE